MAPLDDLKQSELTDNSRADYTSDEGAPRSAQTARGHLKAAVRCRWSANTSKEGSLRGRPTSTTAPHGSNGSVRKVEDRLGAVTCTVG